MGFGIKTKLKKLFPSADKYANYYNAVIWIRT